MNQEKYEAARRLNELETANKVIGENIVKIEGQLALMRTRLHSVAEMIVIHRAVIASMPD